MMSILGCIVSLSQNTAFVLSAVRSFSCNRTRRGCAEKEQSQASYSVLARAGRVMPGAKNDARSSSQVAQQPHKLYRRRFKSYPRYFYGFVAQQLEHSVLNRGVVSANLTGAIHTFVA